MISPPCPSRSASLVCLFCSLALYLKVRSSRHFGHQKLWVRIMRRVAATLLYLLLLGPIVAHRLPKPKMHLVWYISSLCTLFFSFWFVWFSHFDDKLFSLVWLGTSARIFWILVGDLTSVFLSVVQNILVDSETLVTTLSISRMYWLISWRYE